MTRIDLHTHTTASDGTDSPAQLIENAAAAGIDVLALTDHDTTSGWDEAAAALPAGMVLIRGMEMSCVGRGEDGYPVSVHLLAYLFDPNHSSLAAERKRLREARRARIATMAERMQADGLPIDAERILAEAGPAVGRPHLARALTEAGVVSSVQESFQHLLSPRGPYYVPMRNTDLGSAVAMVREAGGVPVLAHARASARGRLVDLEHIENLAESGALAGLEIDHPDHSAPDRELLLKIAHRYSLIMTGSSDYHGANKHIRLGAFTTAPAQLDAIVAAGTGVEVVVGE
ncbi:PHP domain-containing protein [Hoyosella altamirensis]|uniref:Polymerase/histidinol phosphatase N-terminal domain-containing protein n=1 Tax=Hoyosella altamirensis TaxID=616997 RepID=A0A839RJ06_9ACTN|nr:PHP domain-containing protein [Hoyosella altamirensis]MBB3036116.1 hypothetical protein [Hoyosella altamirensis]